MSLKTLDEILQEGIEVFPPEIDALTKLTIEDWFGYRKVANNRYFPNWFWRVLKRDYPRYMEILRIEARTAGSEYDWLVTNYEERQVEIKNNEKGIYSESGNNTSTNNRTFTAGVKSVTVDTGEDKTGGTVVTEHSGTDTNVNTKNLTHNETENKQTNAQGSNNNTRTPNLTYSTEGQDGRSDTTNNNVVRTPDITTENRGSNNNTVRHGVLQRQAPYDADYAGNSPQLNQNVNHGVGPEGVDLSPVKMVNDSHFMSGFPNLSIQNPTSASDELSDTSDINYTENHESGTESTETTGSVSSESSRSETRHDTGTETNNGTTSNSETADTTIQGSDTGTDTDERTLDLADEETTDITVSRTGRREITNSGSDLDNSTVTGNTAKQSNNNIDKTGLERTIFTGRSGQSPQLLLKDAIEFIKNTSAWLFLYRQLSPCFMMVYDTDDYEEV